MPYSIMCNNYGSEPSPVSTTIFTRQIDSVEIVEQKGFDIHSHFQQSIRSESLSVFILLLFILIIIIITCCHPWNNKAAWLHPTQYYIRVSSFSHPTTLYSGCQPRVLMKENATIEDSCVHYVSPGINNTHLLQQGTYLLLFRASSARIVCALAPFLILLLVRVNPRRRRCIKYLYSHMQCHSRLCLWLVNRILKRECCRTFQSVPCRMIVCYSNHIKSNRAILMVWYGL